MRRVDDDDDFFPPIRRTRSSGGFPTWIGPAIGAGIIGLFVVFFVVLLAVRKRNERERADAARPSAPAESNSLGPVPPDTMRPAPTGPNRPAPIIPNPFVPAPVRPAAPALRPGLRETSPIGGIFAQNDYREYRPDGAVLIGFQIGLGAVPDTAVVTYLRPIWLTARGEEYGTPYGRTRNPIATVKARDGYAIGGMRTKDGGAIEGICFTFMRRGEKHLIAGDSYVSDWYGEPTRKLPGDLRNGDGEFVVGIFGKRFDDKGGFEFDNCGGIGTIGLVLWVKE